LHLKVVNKVNLMFKPKKLHFLKLSILQPTRGGTKIIPRLLNYLKLFLPKLSILQYTRDGTKMFPKLLNYLELLQSLLQSRSLIPLLLPNGQLG